MGVKVYYATSANVIKHYLAGGQRIATRDNEGLKYNHTDHLGSASRTSDTNGAQIKALWYDPWGKEAASSGSVTVKYKFTGQEFDGSTTGLYYYRARYYDPALGRFLSADTLVPSPGHPQSFNRYSYVLGNPLRYIDPTGHCIPGEPGCPYDEDGNPLPPSPRPPAVHLRGKPPVFSQLNNAVGMQYTSCGPTTYAMGATYSYGTNFNPQTVAQFAADQGWYLPNDPKGVYTSPANMYKIAKHYAKQQGHPSPKTGNITSSAQAQDLLREQLRRDRPVIVDVTTRFEQQPAPAHFVLVTGIDSDGTVYFNDPLTETDAGYVGGTARSTSWENFWWSWWNNNDANKTGNGWWMVLPEDSLRVGGEQQ